MKQMVFLFFVLPFLSLAGEVSVTSVTAQPHYPVDGLVDIVVTIQGVSNDVEGAVCLFAATNIATKAPILVSHMTRNGEDTGSDTAWTRKFIWDAEADVGEVKIDDIALTVNIEIPLGSVQLWENGPYWAECNVGATRPEEYGYYFWWGDTIGYKHEEAYNRWDAVDGSKLWYEFGGDGFPVHCPTYGKDASQLQMEGYIDANYKLVAAHDAATAHWGAPWRMPTGMEFEALISNCVTTWTTRNGVNGMLVTGKGAYESRSIFLPAVGLGYESDLRDLGSSGYYWSSSRGYMDHQGSMLYVSSYVFSSSAESRDWGMSVRPVRGFASATTVGGGVTTHLLLDFSIGTVSATGVTARPRYPWNGLVDIVVTIQGASQDVAETECLFFATNCATKAAISVSHITRNGADSGSGITWTRKFIWDAWADVGEVKIDDVALMVNIEIQLGSVQLWENGPYWAECNVGATRPEEYGYYFWWGDTVGYKRVGDRWDAVDGSRTNFSFCDENCPTCGKPDWMLQSEGYIGLTGNLVAAHDAATAYLGASWRMPTYEEFFALIDNCDTEWISRNGVLGQLVKGRGSYSSKSIFLPAAGSGYDSSLYFLDTSGTFWSSNLGDSFSAESLFFSPSSFEMDLCRSCRGQPVRPVRGLAGPTAVGGGAITHLSLNCHEVTISFDAQGGSPTPAAITLYAGSEYGELPTVMRVGYTFDGWYTAATGGTKVMVTTKAMDNAMLYAHWTVVQYPIPELPSSASADEVRAALEGSADAKLQANITDATVYGQYREWAMKIDAETVKGAANSWISFAVDSAALLEKVPVDGDLKIEEFKPVAAEGVFDFTVSVKDVIVGSGATDANLKKVFGLGGTTRLGTEDFDSDKVALEFGTPVNGKLKFTASPKDKTAKSFFMKMKVK